LYFLSESDFTFAFNLIDEKKFSAMCSPIQFAVNGQIRWLCRHLNAVISNEIRPPLGPGFEVFQGMNRLLMSRQNLNLSAVANVILFILLTVQVSAAMASSQCSILFEPQQTWKDLMKIDVPIGNTPFGRAPEAHLVSNAFDDARIYQVQKLSDKENPIYLKIDASDVSELAELEPDFHYLGRFNMPALGSHLVIRAKDGTQFTVESGHFKFVWRDPVERTLRLHSYFTRVREIVASGKTDPNLDAFFQRMKDRTQYIYLGMHKSIQRKHEHVEEFLLEQVKDSEFSTVMVKRTKVRTNVIVETYETEMRSSFGGKWRAQGETPPEAAAQGRAHQKEIIGDVLSFIFPLYAERRGWQPSFFVTLYRKALQLADQTRTIVVRSKNPDGSAGPIIATMSLNRAVHGKVRFFDETDDAWKELYGPFTNLYQEAFGFDHDGGYNLPSLPKYWGQDIPILGMESYFGNRPILPRPTVIEDIEFPSFSRPVIWGEGAMPTGADGSPKFRPSPEHPIYYSSGVIYEPKTFGVAKESELRGVAYSEVLIEVFQSIFNQERDLDFGLHAQHLYTYNDSTGILLYKMMGFQVLAGAPTLHKDGVDWKILSLAPENLAQQLRDPRSLAKRYPKEFVQAFTDSLAKTIEVQAPASFKH
jgi:hypothetical protein